MNKITIITGAQGVGKTTKARELSKDKIAVWSYSEYLSRALKNAPENVEIIIFEDVFNLDCLEKLLTTKKVLCRTNRKTVRLVQVPDLIITTNLPIIKGSADNNITIINL